MGWRRGDCRCVAYHYHVVYLWLCYVLPTCSVLCGLLASSSTPAYTYVVLASSMLSAVA